MTLLSGGSGTAPDGFPRLSESLPSASGGSSGPTAGLRRICRRQRCERSGPCRPEAPGSPALLSVRYGRRPRYGGKFPGARVVRHQYQIAARQADKGGERSAFVAAFFFINLHDNFLTFPQYVFDIRTTMRIVVGGEVFAGDFFEGRKP